MIITLDGPWLLATDPQDIGREQEWWRGPAPEAKPTPVPWIIQGIFPGYHGIAWYWHDFQAAANPHPRGRYLLRFGAVDYKADVWLNDAYVGGHEGGETPFSLDVTGTIAPSGANRLAVRVVNPAHEPVDGLVLKQIPHRNKAVPHVPGSSYDSGGILLPVELLAVPEVRIADLYARPDLPSGEIRLTISVRNDGEAPVSHRLAVTVSNARTGEAQGSVETTVACAVGDSQHELVLSVGRPRLWSLEDPFLYQVTAILEAGARDRPGYEHQVAIRCGFRDLRVADGYFRMNGKRIFIRSTHTGNHFPMGQVVPPTPDLMCRDLLLAKTLGFNMVRFIAGMAWPQQLDFCDEIGLMVYEENLAGWCLEDSPEMPARFARSTLEMVARDRNHPSVTIWGLLNETVDGPVFRQAVEILPRLRELDDTRLVLLGSGRWDCQWSIGSASNPGSAAWEHVWGAEAPDALPAPYSWSLGYPGGYFQDAGDAHVYPHVPQTAETNRFIRTLGQDTRPVFLSEYGIGSLMNAIRELRGYEQHRADPQIEDMALLASMSERLSADWSRYGLGGVYPFPEDMLRDSQRLHARQRLLGFDLIRSNPRISGFNLTVMLDHGMTGEGVWTFWREWKPGIADAMSDGWAPVRWCLFVNPLHSYVGRAITLEAVLANEGDLAPGGYPVRFRVSGPAGIVWERAVTLRAPAPAPGEDGPLAVPVLCEQVALDGPAGEYLFSASMERGGAPAGGRLGFYLSDQRALPQTKGVVTVWGMDAHSQQWLMAHGLRCRPFERRASPGHVRSGTNARSGTNDVILVGDPGAAADDGSAWQDLNARIAAGATAIFLCPEAFRRGEDSTYWLPLGNRGRCVRFNDWLYHKECVAKAHSIFEGLQGRGILDWDYYDQVIPQHFFEGQDTPDDVAAVAFAVGYSCPGGYASGVLLGAYRLGAGRIVLNTMRVLEHLDRHPAADRLLLNLIRYAQNPDLGR